MVGIEIEILQDHLVLFVDDAVMPAVSGGVDLKKLALVLEPTGLERLILDRKEPSFIDIVGLILAGIHIQIRADHRMDL